MRAPSKTVRAAKQLRRQLTLPEIILWTHLRNAQLAGLRFRRQHPIGPFVLDFYCPAAHLCVEVDGRAHDTAEQAARDDRRTQWLAQAGIRVLRLNATDILQNETLEGALLAITEAASAP
jgi:very-short-patch-repair endonuclease